MAKWQRKRRSEILEGMLAVYKTRLRLWDNSDNDPSAYKKGEGSHLP